MLLTTWHYCAPLICVYMAEENVYALKSTAMDLCQVTYLHVIRHIIVLSVHNTSCLAEKRNLSYDSHEETCIFMSIKVMLSGSS